MIKIIEKPETKKALSADEVIAANLAMVADGLATLRQFFQPNSENDVIAVELESCRRKIAKIRKQIL
ncbi:hypothetical protein [Ructibacterium gallinarum]|uniref:Uncharacterized protein n=1 Tax=Ructibacterium gallinarum TaxID=2779355 RepID=A0A9D5M2Z3_9FIRM|nr:hypothetical protein [Ructibacterium gallinarum]MBE5041166.1 hypothetical protein [Ructibacterium gallinarum]